MARTSDAKIPTGVVGCGAFRRCFPPNSVVGPQTAMLELGKRRLKDSAGGWTRFDSAARFTRSEIDVLCRVGMWQH
jgi:hypothetical protein